MSDEKSRGLDLEVLRERLRKTPAATLSERVQREKQAMAEPADARRLRVGVRTVQMNLRVTPEFKERVYQLARDMEVTMTELMERGIEALTKSEKKKDR
jgi:hypothetical protein